MPSGYHRGRASHGRGGRTGSRAPGSGMPSAGRAVRAAGQDLRGGLPRTRDRATPEPRLTRPAPRAPSSATEGAPGPAVTSSGTGMPAASARTAAGPATPGATTSPGARVGACTGPLQPLVEAGGGVAEPAQVGVDAARRGRSRLPRGPRSRGQRGRPRRRFARGAGCRPERPRTGRGDDVPGVGGDEGPGGGVHGAEESGPGCGRALVCAVAGTRKGEPPGRGVRPAGMRRGCQRSARALTPSPR